MNVIEELLSLHKCDCGRSWCDYFGPSVGEYGSSFSTKEVERLLENAKKLITHLKSLVPKE